MGRNKRVQPSSPENSQNPPSKAARQTAMSPETSPGTGATPPEALAAKISAAVEGEPSQPQSCQGTPLNGDIEQEIQDILQSELNTLTELDTQSKTMISLNVKITAKILV